MKLYRSFSAILLVLLTAIINWLAQPNEIFNWGNPIFGLISFIPLYYFFLEEARHSRFSPRYFLNKKLHRVPASRITTRVGAFYGLITTLSSYFWLANFGGYSLWTIGAVSLGYMGVYSALFRTIYSHFVKPEYNLQHDSFKIYRPILFAVTWTGFEIFKSRGYLAFPWNFAAFPFHNFQILNQVVELTGVWIISLSILVLQASLSETIFSRVNSPKIRFVFNSLPKLELRYLFASLIVIVLFSTYGIIRLQTLNYPEKNQQIDNNDFLVLLVQQNADSWNTEDWISPLETVIDLSLQGIEEAKISQGRVPDLVSWSETSLRFPFQLNRQQYEQIPPTVSMLDYLDLSETELITGNPLIRGDSSFLNGVVHIDSKGNVLGDYGKIHLIPFAEHIPLVDIPYFSDFLKNVIGLPGSGWTPGTSITVLSSQNKNLNFGTPICFEDSFANNTRAFVLAGADLLLNLTNNSWSQTVSAQTQHFVASRYRAIENRRPLLRSTNGGVTAVILPDGSIQAQIPMFEPGYLLVGIDDYYFLDEHQVETLYTKYGDWFAWLIAVAILCSVILRFELRNL